MSRFIHLIALSALVVVAARSAFAEEPVREIDAKAQAKELVSAMKSKDPAIRLEAATKARDNQETTITSALLRLLSDKDGHVRDAAIDALAMRSTSSQRKKAASSLAGRMPRLQKHPADREELNRVIEALGRLQQPASIRPLLDPIDKDMEIEEVQARMNAVAEIPHKESVERLIQFLARGRKGEARNQKGAAQRALITLTGIKGNRDPDSWRAWWREHGKDFDFEYVAQERADAEADRQARDAKKEERRKQRAEKKNKRNKDKKKSDGAGGGSDQA